MDMNMKRMMADIESEVHYTRSMIGKDALDPRVMQVMARVPRDKFVPPEMKAAAFDNGPLPIGHGQTISQPYIVALMTDLLELQPEHVVLEVGTGSGYQTAILCELCRQVYSVEVVAALSEAAAARLKRLGYANVETRIGNGYQGWTEKAPFDAIAVTAAAPSVPPALLEQLKPGGRMLIPIGSRYLTQKLVLVSRDEQGAIRTRELMAVVFVPLTGEH